MPEGPAVHCSCLKAEKKLGVSKKQQQQEEMDEAKTRSGKDGGKAEAAGVTTGGSRMTGGFVGGIRLV